MNIYLTKHICAGMGEIKQIYLIDCEFVSELKFTFPIRI